MTVQENEFLPELTAYIYATAKSTSGKAPSERELAEHFSISRGQVREALAILEAMSVIERRAKSGIYLVPGRSGLDTMTFYAKAGIPLEPKQVLEAVELRNIHETAAAEMAAERATDENFERIRDILVQCDKLIDDGMGIFTLDHEFHLEIVNATQNVVFYDVCKSFYRLSEQRLPVYFNNVERSKKSHMEHQQIFEALVRRDGSLAKALMNSHLRGAMSYWNELLETGDDAAD